MPPTIALILCVVVVAVLLRLERTRNPSASAALWVPTCWMLISGSRPIGRWVGLDQTQQSLDGSPMDRLVLSVLMLLALVIVYAKRKSEWSPIVRDNVWLILLFFYMALSALWADYPFVSLKRWSKSAGPILMALVILTEPRPLDAFSSILRRCAYVLVPTSLVLIKYFPEFGRAYNRWTGVEMWTGVATHKNSLGQVCGLAVFFLTWELLRKGRSRGLFRTRSHIYADVFVLALAIFLLIGPGAGAYSASSIFITVLGVATFMVLDRMEGLGRLIAAKLKVVVVLLVLMCLVFANMLMPTVTSMLGRNEDLTGRTTDVWPLVLEVGARHPVLGAGYGGVWGLGGELSIVLELEQAHNGYLDVYLELGIVGLVLLSAFFLSFCSRIRRECLDHNFEWGLFGLCFLLMILAYNMSETAFFDVYIGVTMVLMAVVFSACLQEKADGGSRIGLAQGSTERGAVVWSSATSREAWQHPAPCDTMRKEG